MTTDKTPEASAPLPGSEGLKPFTWNGANKFDLQTANDLFEELAKDPKNPHLLGKINALKLDVMKRAAEAEISKLTPARTRAQIETEMKEKQVSKAQANDELSYVLVTYLQNVEKLAKEREAAKAAVTVEAKDAATKLKAELPPAATKAETVVVPAKAAEAVKPDAKNPEKEVSAEEIKSAKFIKEHRAEIDVLVAKLPEGTAKSTFPGLLDKPTKENVTVLQTEIGLKAEAKGGADGQFGKITLAALKTYVGAGGKKPDEAVSKPVAKPATEPKKAQATEKPKAKKEKEEEAKMAEEGRKKAEEEETKKKAEAERSVKEKELDALQKKTLANLKPEGNGVYVVNTKFLKDGFAGAVFFKFDAKNGEWLWNAFNNPDEMKSSSWHKVSGLESATTNGSTKLSGFGFNESTQETVNAILTAQKRSKELGIPLKDPNAPSPIVQSIPK